ncbi:MAG TPA: bifunctional enoyl-CoA hydratase/phosphate acetyltransferase [Symbiobacteriaceae bacterium]|nr:bifunctional enoyl-CoA hydratase/phosphate acetyltransferase [Symbiobacteriaceae bacterium]
MIQSFDHVLTAAREKAARKLPVLAVAQANDHHIQEAIDEAERLGLVKALRIVRDDPAEAAREAVLAVRNGEAQLLMKGLLQTATIMKAVLNKEEGLRTGRALSHACAFEIPGWHKLVFVTDAALNVAPDLARKADIIRNQVIMARALGVARPKVACLAAVETVNPDMQATLDARALQEMGERGELGECDVQGPLALDLAVSPESAETKGITGPVVGDADILLAPAIEAGNMLYKGLVYFAKARPAGLIMGARCPIVLLSRADSAHSKLMSIALAVLSAD